MPVYSLIADMGILFRGSYKQFLSPAEIWMLTALPSM
jgi:hypothetical protein